MVTGHKIKTRLIVAEKEFMRATDVVVALGFNYASQKCFPITPWAKEPAGTPGKPAPSINLS